MSEENDLTRENNPEDAAAEAGEDVASAATTEATEKETAAKVKENVDAQKSSQFVPVWQVVANNVFVLLSLSLQYLGLNPDEAQKVNDTENINLEQAKLAIDLSDMMLEKIKDNLPPEELKGLENMLASAKFRYVSVKK